MKQINFIKSLTPAQQHELTQWYFLSTIATSIVVTSMIVLQVRQIYRSYQDKCEVLRWESKQKTMHHQQDKKNKLLSEKQNLENQLASLHHRTTRSLPTIFNMIIKTAQSVSIQTLSVHKNDLLCTIICSKPAEAVALTHQLIANGAFETVKLTRLKTYGDNRTQTVQATLHAILQVTA